MLLKNNQDDYHYDYGDVDVDVDFDVYVDGDDGDDEEEEEKDNEDESDTFWDAFCTNKDFFFFFCDEDVNGLLNCGRKKSAFSLSFSPRSSLELKILLIFSCCLNALPLQR